MSITEILNLPDGVHVVTIDSERCMVIRSAEGFTLTRFLPNQMMHIQRYDDQANLTREDYLENIFAANDDKEEKL